VLLIAHCDSEPNAWESRSLFVRGDCLVGAFGSVIHFFEVVTVRGGRRKVG
jgi:hypothetical protein